MIMRVYHTLPPLIGCEFCAVAMQHALPQWVKDFLRNYVGITTGEPQIAADLRCRQSRQSRATSGHLEGADRRIVSGVRFSGDRTKFGPPPLAPARDARQVE